MTALLRITEARKTWRRGRVHALAGVSLEVARGHIVGLVGPNGAGKSTLLAAVMGFVRLDGGTVTIGGHPAGSLAARRATTWLPQAFPVEPRMSGHAMLSWLHELGGGDARARASDVGAALAAVGLDEAASRRRLTDYSGGMRQRLGIAQAFLGSASLIILDEPTAGLDPVGVSLLRSAMRAARDRGASVVMSSHHLDEVARACDDVVFMSRGRMLTEKPSTADEMERLFLSAEGGAA